MMAGSVMSTIREGSFKPVANSRRGGAQGYSLIKCERRRQGSDRFADFATRRAAQYMQAYMSQNLRDFANDPLEFPKGEKQKAVKRKLGLGQQSNQGGETSIGRVN